MISPLTLILKPFTAFLTVALLFSNISPATALTNPQNEGIETIERLVVENPKRAIELSRRIDTTLSEELSSMVNILQAKAFLNLNYTDSAQHKIGVVMLKQTLNHQVELNLMQAEIGLLIRFKEYKTANQKIEAAIQKADREKMYALSAKYTELKVELLKQQKLHDEALRLLLSKILKYEKEHHTEAYSIAYQTLGKLYFQTEQFSNATDCYKKALLGFQTLHDTLSEITIYKNLSLTYRGLSRFDDAESRLDKARKLAIAKDLPAELADVFNLMGSLMLRSGKMAEAIEYYEQSRTIREELDYIHSAAATIENLSRAQRRLNRFDDALASLKTAIALREQLNDYRNLAATYNEIGNLYAEQKRYADALMNYLTSLKIRKEHQFGEDIARSLTNIGITYGKIGSPSNALNYLEQAIEIIEDQGDPLSQAYIFVQHGNTLRELNRPLDAIGSFSQALKLRKQTGNLQSIAQAHKSLSYAYMDLKQYKNAYEHLSRALEIAKNLGDEIQMADIFNELGNIYLLTKEYPQAISYFQQSALLYSKQHNIEKRALCLRKIGEAQIALGRFQHAHENLELALKLSSNADNPKLRELIFHAYYDFYLQKGEYQKALEYYTKSISVRDSIEQSKNREEIWEATFNLELYEQIDQIKQIEIQMEVLRAETELKTVQLEKEKLLRNLIATTSAFIIILAIGILYGFFIIRRKNKNLSTANEKLSQSEQELKKLIQTKDRLFSIIAHDLRSPFTALLGFTELLTQQDLSPEQTREFSEHLHTSSLKLVNLIENLLQWSRSQLGSIKLTPETINLAGMVNEIIHVQQLQADAKEINIQSRVDDNHTLFADYQTLATVLRNLISNGIKFTPNGGSIAIATEESGNGLIISVSDTGVGMSSDEIDKLFKIEESYTKPGTNNEAGTGLGLIVCKEFVELNGGQIRVLSTLGVGTTFNLEFFNQI